MCIIAVQPKGNIILDETIDRMWERNKDGGGYAFVDHYGTMQIKKFSDKKLFLTNWSKDIDNNYAYSPFLFHFRIKTHGKVNWANIHPFKVHDDLVFAHNGVIKIDIPPRFANRGWSDTRYFNKAILQHLNPNFFRDGAYRSLVERFIDHSKLAFLNTDGETFIFNKDKGTMDGDVWYSNGGFKDIASTTPATGNCGSYAGWQGGYNNPVPKPEEKPEGKPLEPVGRSSPNSVPASVALNNAGLCHRSGPPIAPGHIEDMVANIENAKKDDILITTKDGEKTITRIPGWKKNEDGTFTEPGGRQVLLPPFFDRSITEPSKRLETNTKGFKTAKSLANPAPKRDPMVGTFDNEDYACAVDFLTSALVEDNKLFGIAMSQYCQQFKLSEGDVWGDKGLIMAFKTYYEDNFFDPNKSTEEAAHA